MLEIIQAFSVIVIIFFAALTAKLIIKLKENAKRKIISKITKKYSSRNRISGKRNGPFEDSLLQK